MNADNWTPPWNEAQIGFVRRALRFDPQTLGLVGWLAGRWRLPPEAVAAEVLALALLGRLRTERLKAADALQGRWSFGGGDSQLVLHWPAACDMALVQRAAISGESVDRAGSSLLRLQLVGRLRPDEVSLLPQPTAAPSLTEDDASLSLHLPDSLMARLIELEDLVDLTRNDILRDTLLLHAVGRVRYEQWTGQGQWRPRRKAPLALLSAYEEGEIRFSRTRWDPDDAADESSEPGTEGSAEPPPASAESSRTAFIREHGKSLNAVRVHLPAWMKLALEELASPAREPTASYCRRALVAEI